MRAVKVDNVYYIKKPLFHINGCPIYECPGDLPEPIQSKEENRISATKCSDDIRRLLFDDKK